MNKSTFMLLSQFMSFALYADNEVYLKTVAANRSIDTKRFSFMTQKDILKDSVSDITIRNTSVSNAFNVTGLYIQSLYTYSSGACSSSAYYNNSGYILGEMWTQGVNFPVSSSQNIGANYLYTMLMTYLYESAIATITTLSPLTANTPGNAFINAGSGSASWCIKLGIMQGSSPTQYATSAIASTTTPSISTSEVTNLVASASAIQIKITCSDATQQCTLISGSSEQAFPV